MAAGRTYSEEVAGLIDEEIKAILDDGYQLCKELLSGHMEELERTAQYLLEFETMSAEDFALVFDDPAALEAREEITRVQQAQKAKEDAEARARIQAEREAESARRLREADELLHGKTEEPKKPDPPDPF